MSNTQAAGTGSIPLPETVEPIVPDSGLESQPGGGVETEEMPNYLPWIMRSWPLYFFSIIPLAMVGGTEYLISTSGKHTGLFDDNSSEPKIIFRNIVTQFFGLPILYIIGIFFSDLDQAVKQTEPFYQLSKPEGASGRDSLCVNYFQPPLIYYTPILAIRHKHWAVLCSSLTVIISTNILPILALGVFSDDVNDKTPIDLEYTRAFEGFLGFLCFLAIVLAILIHKRNSGLTEYPGNFQAILKFTSNRNHEGSLYNFFGDLGIDDRIAEKDLNSRIGGFRFRLQRRDSEVSQFDIVRYHGNVTPPWYRRAWSGFKVWIREVRGRLYSDNHPMLFQRIPLLFTTAVLLVLFIIANGQPFLSAKRMGFSMFLREQRLARSAISALINTVIWAQLDRSAKLMEPIYLLLNKDGAPLSVLRLDYLGKWPLQDLYYFFTDAKKMSKNRISKYVILTIMLATYASGIFSLSWNILNLNSSCSGPSFWASWVTMIICELIMLAAVAAIFIYRRRPVLPRQPTTLASILLLVYATNLPGKSDLIVSNLVPSPGPDPINASTPPTSTREEMPRSSEEIDLGDSRRSSSESISAPSPAPSLHRAPGYEAPAVSSRHADTEGESSRISEPYGFGELGDIGMGPIPIISRSTTSDQVSLAPSSVGSHSTTNSDIIPGTGGRCESSLQVSSDPTIEDSGARCGLGLFEDSDGKTHLGIGKHDSVRPYKFGMGSPSMEGQV